MRSSGVLPPRETAERLIRIFELEKAVYELGYELANRPDWVGDPGRRDPAPARRGSAGRSRPRGWASPAGSARSVEPGIVEFRVWAPNARHGRGRRRPPRARGRRRVLRRGSPARAGRRLRLLARRRQAASPTRARAGSRRACAARRACSTRRSSSGRADAGRRARSTTLVIYELHVGTFTPEGTFDAAVGAAARARGARRHRGRADAGRDLPGRARLGLRRRPHLRAAPRLRRPARARALRRRRPRRRARGDPRRRLQPRRPGLGAARRLRPVLHRPPPHVLGRRDRLLPAGGARVGDPERRALGPRLPHRRPAARRDARDLRRERAARHGASSPTASAPRIPARS